MQKYGLLKIMAAVLIVAGGCSKKSSPGDDVSAQSDSVAYLAESAVSAVIQSAASSEGEDDAAGFSAKATLQATSAASCPTSITPTVRCGGSGSNVSLLNYDSMGNGAGSPCSAFGFAVYGRQSLEFNSGAACSAFNPPSSWPGAGSTLHRTLSSFRAYHVASGLTIEAGTDPYPDYQGVSHGGGAQIQFNGVPGDRLVSIQGYNRKLTNIIGRTLFNHSIFTEQPIVINGTFAAGNRVANGAVKITHNIARYTANVSLNDLRWTDRGCCFPVSGRVVNQLSGSLNGTFTVEFTGTCGRVNFSDSSGQSCVVQLNSCR